MTTYVGARDALVAHINTAWTSAYPSVPIIYENTLSVDRDKVGDVFVTVSIDFTDAVQSDIDLTTGPGERVYGEALFTLNVKEGGGVRTTMQKMDFLNSLMKFKTLSGVTTQAPAPGRKARQAGWSSQEVIVPFTFYSEY